MKRFSYLAETWLRVLMEKEYLIITIAISAPVSYKLHKDLDT